MNLNLNWFDEQIRERRKYDEQELSDAFVLLASSVAGKQRNVRFTLDDAALADSAIDAVMAYYGSESVEVPREITDPMDRIDYVVRPTGIMRRPVRLEGTWWKSSTGAYLGKLKEGGLVALIPSGMRGYGYVDPATGQKVPITKKTAQNLEEDALCFYRPFPQRELSIRDVLKFMAKSLSVSDYVLILLSMAVSTFLGFMPAIANKLLFGSIIPSGMVSLIFPIASLLLGMMISRALVQSTTQIVTQRLNIKLQIQMEAASYARILLLPPTFFKEYAAGDLANRSMAMSQMVDTLSQMIMGSGLTGVFALAYVFQVFAYAPQLVIPALIVVLVQAAASITAVHVSMRYNRVQTQESTKLSGLTPALLHGIQKIKLAGAERRTFAQWVRAYAKVAQATYNRPAALLAAPALISVIGVMGTILIYYLAAATKVSVADYMAFNAAFGSVTGAINAFAMGITTFSTIQPLLELIEPIMKAVPETLSNQRQVTSIRGDIEVSNLSFRYNDHSPMILDDLSLKVHSGEYVAIVGRTGCGKSTLMRLLLGFEKPNKGSIMYGGLNVSKVDVRSLRRHIGVVMQNGSLFRGDLFMNITVAAPKATMDDAWEAARLAGIEQDIRKMPMGMQTLVSEGSGGISGGQKQRIMIARAVCGKPKVLMLDEATSALDNITQRHVSESLADLKCTRIVIAHRLSTIRQADRIILLEHGKIAEEGSYEELIQKKGKFADLVERQRLEGE